MMTQLMHLQQPNSLETPATITAMDTDAKGFYIRLDRTLFYPQGGGQPADQGQIDADNTILQIHDVRRVEGEIRHYVFSEPPIKRVNHKVNIVVDKTRRDINSRYHTAGHLLAAVVEKLSPALQATKGHQFPGEAYVEFHGVIDNATDFLETIQSAVTAQLNRDAFVETKDLKPEDAKRILAALPYALPEDKTLRVCHIEGFPPVPCGGTHVSRLQQIGRVIIKKCKSKKGKTKLSYEVENA